ncbi:3-hydroxyacyl-CoA dehydrogenase NAD-binding domain-containing protein [Congregibacter sp.]|uniref:3-hydroxyacyl-CoA dehydrogenase NAD-binding domain-containing protein n=1 Tax=Congregibacter sp. TaxID=2744308 RepID=UPI003F6A9BFA
MRIPEINQVCFVGAGTMGCFNALLAASAGYESVVYDVSAETLAAVPESLQGMAGFLAGHGLLKPDAIPDLLARISTSDDLAQATRHSDLVSESVSERLAVKRQVHGSLDKICNADTLITTNTSGLLVSQIEDALVHGKRFAALHSHLGSRLFDIVGGPRTSAHSIDVLKRYVLSLDCVPLILKKENPGYVINAMLGPLLTVSQVMAIDGVATKEDIDRAWMKSEQAKIGPFGLMDLFGLNVVQDSWQHPKPHTEHLQAKVLGFVTPYVEAGHLGVKTGRGFYNYPDPEYGRPGFCDTTSDLTLVYRILSSVLIANAICIAAAKVAPPSEIDRAWMLSFDLPRGPFGMLDAMGIETFLTGYLELVGQGVLPEQPAAKISRYLQTFIDKGLLGQVSGQGIYRYPNPAYEASDFIPQYS